MLITAKNTCLTVFELLSLINCRAKDMRVMKFFFVEHLSSFAILDTDSKLIVNCGT